MSSCCTKKSPFIYRPRRPEKTVLFEVIKKHYKTWLSKSENPIPKYVQEEFEDYLGCGILTKGFAYAFCDTCRKDYIIGFSCKGRGICPSCNTRAMVESAANLVENVIPCVPVRQFVISFPRRIRHYLQTPSILQTILRIVVDEIRKKLIECSPNLPNPKIGAVSFFQNFGNTLNVHPHFHLIVADGIFTIEEETLLFCELPAFKSENLRKNGPWLNYRFPKPTHTGQQSINLEPLEFLEKISKFIPYPRKHRRHYHGVFAPHSPLRQQITANAKKCLLSSIPPAQQEAATKTEKVSLNWAKLIARIYEVNPLICHCGKEIKIRAFITHSAEIRRILGRLGWPRDAIEFDPPYDFEEREICQLVSDTEDGFPADIPEFFGENGPDPPFIECSVDPPHWDDNRDPPHWDD